MRVRAILRVLAAFCLLTLCSCARMENEEIARLRAERDAAKAEAAAATAALAQLKDSVGAKPGTPAPGDPDEVKVLELGKEFVGDLEKNRLASAYRSTTAAYQKKVERKDFDAMVGKHSNIRHLDSNSYSREHKVRKTADAKGYEFYFTGRNPFGTGRGLVNVAVTWSREDGEWRVVEWEILEHP